MTQTQTTFAEKEAFLHEFASKNGLTYEVGTAGLGHPVMGFLFSNQTICRHWLAFNPLNENGNHFKKFYDRRLIEIAHEDAYTKSDRIAVRIIYRDKERAVDSLFEWTKKLIALGAYVTDYKTGYRPGTFEAYTHGVWAKTIALPK